MAQRGGLLKRQRHWVQATREGFLEKEAIWKMGRAGVGGERQSLCSFRYGLGRWFVFKAAKRLTSKIPSSALKWGVSDPQAGWKEKGLGRVL